MDCMHTKPLHQTITMARPLLPPCSPQQLNIGKSATVLERGRPEGCMLEARYCGADKAVSRV